MNKSKIDQVKKEVGPESFKMLVEAATLVESMNGISITGDREKQIRVVAIVSPILRGAELNEKRLTKKVAENILKEAEKKRAAGMDGEGTYFIN